MIEKLKKFLKFPHKSLEFKKERVYRKPNITKIWNMVIILGIVAFMLSVLWHTYRFYKLESKDFTKSYLENLTGNERIDENKLDQVIQKFESRDAEFDAISGANPSVVDPSL